MLEIEELTESMPLCHKALAKLKEMK